MHYDLCTLDLRKTLRLRTFVILVVVERLFFYEKIIPLKRCKDHSFSYFVKSLESYCPISFAEG